jgi:MOSC domain-containing protein YiiM
MNMKLICALIFLFGAFRVCTASALGASRRSNLEPRMPCYKLGIKFGRSDIVKRFLAGERTGFYFAVLQEGEVKAGDPIELMENSERSETVSDVTQLYTREKHNVGLLRRAIEVEALPDSWKNYFQHRLEKLTGPSQD